MVRCLAPCSYAARGWSLRGLFAEALAGDLGTLTFLDLDTELVGRELERMHLDRRSGPHAENMLRELGIVGSDSQSGG